MSRSTMPVFFFLLLVFLWLIPVGMTFNGIIALVEAQPISLALLMISTLTWMIGRWRGKWQAYRTPFDLALLVWGGAIGLSILANLDTWRRSAEALWYVALYAVLFYALADLLANRTLTRLRLMVTLLLVGALLILIGLWQVVAIFLSDATFATPVSLLGNVNAFGAILAPLTVMSATLALMQKPWRKVMIAYTLIAGALLTLTFSRGALLGAVAGVAFVISTYLYDHDLRTPAQWRERWQTLSASLRLRLSIAGGVAGIILLALAIMIVQSLSVGGRTVDNRTFLWECALTIFTEQPLTGSGLYTYGRTLPYCEPIPPQQPHSHPHSLPLLILAEMGIVGICALALTIFLAGRAWIDARRVLTERPVLMASGGAIVAMLVHHLLDTPAMMPSVALWVVVTLAIATLPTQNAHIMTATWRKHGHALTLSVVMLVMLVSGVWAMTLHQQYRVILMDALIEENWQTSAIALEEILQADPANNAYRLQTAYLWGRAAAEGDPDAIQRAITHYERYLQAEPHHTANWANLASLYWQAGDAEHALEAMAIARDLAPGWAHYETQQAIYALLAPPTADTLELSHGRNRDGANYARLQFLRDIITTTQSGEYLPQVGWGTTPR